MKLSVHLKCISVGGLWMDRPCRSPSQSSNQSKFVSFEFQHLPGNYGGNSWGIYNVIHSMLILSDAEMQHLIQLVANVSVLIGAQVNLVTAALAHCPPSTCIKQIETLDLWNLCKAPLGKFRQHRFQVLSSKRIARIDEFVRVCSQESSRRITSKHSFVFLCPSPSRR